MPARNALRIVPVPRLLNAVSTGKEYRNTTGLTTGLSDSWQDESTRTGKDLVNFQEGIP